MLALCTVLGSSHISYRAAGGPHHAVLAHHHASRPARCCRLTMMAEQDSPRDRLHNLMLQSSIQTQLSYYNEFKNELQARWLTSFLGHEHLGVKRTQGTGPGQPSYRGVEGALRCSWREYLRTMLRGQPQKYEVSYKVGTADTVGTARAASGSGDGATGGGTGTGYLGTGQEAPWAAAAASRAANPYLKKTAQYRKFEQVISPPTVARGLMSIRAQLALEWSYDLKIHAREGRYISDVCADEEACVLDDDIVPSRSPIAGAGESRTSLGETAVADPFSSLPPMVTTSFRAATLEWGQQEDLGEAQSTPFRELNFDLLQRALSREAALATLSSLNQRPEAAASAQWLRSKLENY